MISSKELEKLRGHAAGSGLSAVAKHLANIKFIESADIYTSTLINPFAQIDSEAKCSIYKLNEDFVFLLTTNTNSNTLGDHFPFMLPRYAQSDERQFPDLAAAVINSASWHYVYFSTTDNLIQEQLYALLPVGILPDLGFLKGVTSTDAWQGALHYSGSYGMPWNKLLPIDGPLNELVKKLPLIPVKGSVLNEGILTQVTLQVPLLSIENPFSGGIIKNISLAVALMTPLYEGVPILDAGHIELSGRISIGDTAAISLSGLWPLYNGDIIIKAICKLNDISSCLKGSALATLNLPASASVSLELSIAKSTFSLDSLNFNIVLSEWKVSNFFLLQKVGFDVTIFNPGTASKVIGKFTASAKLGNNIFLQSWGIYPSGEFYLGLDPNHPVNLNALITELSGINGILPDGLMLTELNGKYHQALNIFSFNAAVANDAEWQPGDTGFKLKNVRARVSKGTDLDCSINASFSLAYQGVDGSDRSMFFNVSAIYSSSWYFNATYKGNISLADVAKALNFTNIPSQLSDCTFESFNLVFNTASGFKSISGSVKVKLDDAEVNLLLQISMFGPESGNMVEYSGDFSLISWGKAQSFNVNFVKSVSGYNAKFSLNLEIANLIIGLTAGSNSDQRKIAEKYFEGSASGLSLNLTDALLSLIDNFGHINLPISLPDLIITSVRITYDGAKGIINLSASGAVSDKKIDFYLYKNSTAGSYAFGLLTDVASFGGLPLVGEQLSTVKVANFGFVYTSAEGSYPLNGPTKDYEKGFNFSGELNYGNVEPLKLALPTTSNHPKVSLLRNADKAELQPNTKWFKFGKKIGPVSIGQIGLQYNNGRLGLLINGELSMAALVLSLNGLGLTFALNDLFAGSIVPEFTLDGIGLSYSAPPVMISAAFIRHKKTYNGEEIDVFSGSAVIKASEFTITALGSYSNVKGKPSLFIYGLYEGAIGGPSFFFVTAIAAGFGYNRKINIPAIEEVSSFPLVSLAMDPKDHNLDKILSDLETPMKSGAEPISISPGDYWLGVGVRFTSFKIIESFVLLTVNFGTRLEFGIVGLSRLSWPEKSMTLDPIVYIELALVAHFGPESNLIAVQGIVTPNSYLLSEKCRLTGGFAFYTWVSGEHEGDFVVTLGGYHPAFNKPAHYPTVPRLGLYWKVSDNLTIAGEMYYAITPSAIMAGGKWEVNFHLSFLTVNATVWADMLISWAPYAYEISIGICIKIEADIKILFVRIHFSLEMSATLHIWGPPFAGEAYVDWSIFSFTIPFGDSKRMNDSSLNWHQFSTGFIPHKNNIPDPINISVSEGIIEIRNNDEGKEKFITANAQQLSINIGSFIPTTALLVNGTEVLQDMEIMGGTKGLTYANRTKNLGVIPCRLHDVKITLEVIVCLGDKEIEVSVTGVSKGLTEALWANEQINIDKKNPGAAKVIGNALTGILIKSPLPKQRAEIREFDFSKVFEHLKDELNWTFYPAKMGPAYHAYDVLGYYDEKLNIRTAGVLENSYNKKEVIDNRQLIISLLRSEFDSTLPKINDDQLFLVMQNSADYFSAIPVLCGPGEIPQYSTDVI